MLDTMRIVLKFLSVGESLCRSVIGGIVKEDPWIAKMILLGNSPRKVLKYMQARTQEEKLLITLLKDTNLLNTRLVGYHGSKLVSIFERIEQMRESRKNLFKALSFRGYILSSVLGCILAVISSIAPTVLSFSLKERIIVDSLSIEIFSFVLGAVSSIMIGLFFNMKRFYVNLILTAILFFSIREALSPLVGIDTNSWLLNNSYP
jgi:hypothetical protein